jgi:hypothetical protein
MDTSLSDEDFRTHRKIRGALFGKLDVKIPVIAVISLGVARPLGTIQMGQRTIFDSRVPGSDLGTVAL